MFAYSLFWNVASFCYDLIDLKIIKNIIKVIFWHCVLVVFYLELYIVYRRALNLFFLQIILRRPSLAYTMVLVLVLVLILVLKESILVLILVLKGSVLVLILKGSVLVLILLLEKARTCSALIDRREQCSTMCLCMDVCSTNSFSLRVTVENKMDWEKKKFIGQII